MSTQCCLDIHTRRSPASRMLSSVALVLAGAALLFSASPSFAGTGLQANAADPVILSVYPPDGYHTRTDQLRMKILAYDREGIAAITVNDSTAQKCRTNIWLYTAALESGTNEFIVIAQNKAGNAATQVVTYIRNDDCRPPETNPPVLRIAAPEDYAETDNPCMYVYGSVSDDSGYAAVLVNTIPAYGHSNWHQYVWLRPGTNVITITALDRFRNSTTEIRHAVRLQADPDNDTTPPRIARTFPPDGFTTERETLPLHILAHDNIGVVLLTVNGNNAVHRFRDIWSIEVNLAPGTNDYMIIAQDAAGNASRQLLKLIRTIPRSIPDTTPPILVITEPTAWLVTTNKKVLVQGSAADRSGVALVTVNGITARGTTNWQQFAHLIPGTNMIVVTAVDTCTNTAYRRVPVIFDGEWCQSQKFEFMTYQLPYGYRGKPYSFRLMTRGGEGSVTWESLDDLPDDLALAENGQIYGTPNTTGTFDITVTATDSMGRSITENLDLTIFDLDDSLNILASCLPEVAAGDDCTLALPLRPDSRLVPSDIPGLRMNDRGEISGKPVPGIHIFTVETERNGQPTSERLFWLVSEPEQDTLSNFNLKKLKVKANALTAAARCDWNNKPELNSSTPIVLELGGFIAVAEKAAMSANGNVYRARIKTAEQDARFTLRYRPGSETMTMTVRITSGRNLIEHVNAYSTPDTNAARIYSKVMIGNEIIHISPTVTIKQTANRTCEKLVR